MGLGPLRRIGAGVPDKHLGGSLRRASRLGLGPGRNSEADLPPPVLETGRFARVEDVELRPAAYPVQDDVFPSSEDSVVEHDARPQGKGVVRHLAGSGLLAAGRRAALCVARARHRVMTAEAAMNASLPAPFRSTHAPEYSTG